MTAFIGRREFITLLFGAAALPLAARAQQPAVAGDRVSSTPGRPMPRRAMPAAFRKGLGELAMLKVKT